MTIRVGVLGAAGKMGTTVCEAVEDAEGLELVAQVDPPSGLSGLDALDGCDVAVDFTQPDAVMDNARYCLSKGVHCVIGTTGLSEENLAELEAATGRANCFVAPNFSIGAVLAMRFSEMAAPHFASCEVVELHHNEKLDAPSGTALRTARLVADAWSSRGRPAGGEPAAGEAETVPGARGADVDGVRVHAVRLQGVVAHQEVVFGGPGQTLTIRHDSMDRTSFMPGVILAIKRVGELDGLTVGLEAVLDL